MVKALVFGTKDLCVRIAPWSINVTLFCFYLFYYLVFSAFMLLYCVPSAFCPTIFFWGDGVIGGSFGVESRGCFGGEGGRGGGGEDGCCICSITYIFMHKSYLIRYSWSTNMSTISTSLVDVFVPLSVLSLLSILYPLSSSL